MRLLFLSRVPLTQPCPPGFSLKKFFKGKSPGDEVAPGAPYKNWPRRLDKTDTKYQLTYTPFVQLKFHTGVTWAKKRVEKSEIRKIRGVFPFFLLLCGSSANEKKKINL